MANPTLLDRLTGSGDANNPNIGLHGFIACLREYARGEISAATISSTYGIEVGDTQATALMGLIDAAQDKVAMAEEIGDIITLYEGPDSNSFYPNKQAIATRLGL